MSLAVAGIGWVTPLGSDVSAVWDRLLDGEEAPTEAISTRLNSRAYPVFRVPPDALANIPAHARLRRASAISRFATSAALSALNDAKVNVDLASAARTAVIFATSNGGVNYTTRFYHDIIDTGAQAASPILFPETVFNAPASHLTAILNVTGASYTIVGDGAVGVLALKMAEDLMQDNRLDYCIVVTAEEADWVLCDAYRKWRLLRSAPPIELFQEPPRGMILSEGAGAVVLAREGNVLIERINSGGNFSRQKDAAGWIENIFVDLAVGEIDLVVGSANGTFIDQAERKASLRHCPHSLFYTPKPALGEGVSAGGLWQVICAVQALRTQQIPQLLHTPAYIGFEAPKPRTGNELRRALVPVCGLNQQVAGLLLERK
jgi:3-oxoacyl-(acyl-carrier-protein) synthase